MKPSVTREHRGSVWSAAVLIAVALSAVAAPARAQAPAQDVGTPELDSCKTDPSLGDEERVARASEHFNRGRELYEQGSYAQSVTEFAAAYCHQPNPAPLKNIAQAFERMIEYEKAVAYLERYILELPDDAVQERERTEFRRRVLERQPARVRVATLPEGATVTLVGEMGPVAKIRANGKEPLLVQRGRYTLRVEADGYVPIEQPIVTEIGRPYSYYFRLEPKTGGINITVTPASARIFINQKLVGLGSYASSIPIGTYHVMVEHADREPVERTIEVGAGRSTTVNVSLPEPPRSGRLELLVAGAAVGGILSAGGLASIFDTDSGAASLAGLGGLGVGFLGGFFGIPDDVPQATSSLMIGGTAWAATEGLLVTALATCDVSRRGGEATGCADQKVFFGAGTLAGGLGLLASGLVAPRVHLSAGDVGVINSGGIWGLAAGALLWSTFEEAPRARDPLLLAGLNLGLVAGGIIATQVEVSRSRTALIDLSGLGGALIGVAAAQLSSQAGTGIDRSDYFALIGMTTGLIAGAFLTRHMGDDSAVPALQPRATAVTDATGHAHLGLGVGLDL